MKLQEATNLANKRSAQLETLTRNLKSLRRNFEKLQQEYELLKTCDSYMLSVVPKGQKCYETVELTSDQLADITEAKRIELLEAASALEIYCGKLSTAYFDHA